MRDVRTTEETMLDKALNSLEKLCLDHGLIYNLQDGRYPITLRICCARGLSGQMSLFELEDSGITPDSWLIWTFEDGEPYMEVEGGAFTIGKSLRSKIEAKFSEVVSWKTQLFFRASTEIAPDLEREPDRKEHHEEDSDKEESGEDGILMFPK